ncbi:MULTISPECIES: hypothetical protein [unclassified Lysobacter]|uniref:hypothetical protein n=1 Tax=unclassified Lysobacter TaxID=2635362 RepID=UPI0006FF8C19|nr:MULTISPECIES: hypothetical protein [unclassified Lysobacter]KQZ55856.1 hypothetical protein ASD53_13430 [Lysobacter sp. Root559]KRA72961.1 hypothetical protein ASD78_15235 [Lysobacter sp. Root667]KRC32079.1 hypothetical protein ASE10_16115 [Lysobacter sp. Root76]KRD67542.1 hypothetical protein ASE45_12290 [Lysobacter sp. Root96]
MPGIDPNKFVIVASFVSPGVSQGAGGFAIVGGKVVKIPPRGIKLAMAAYQMLDAADSASNRKLAAQLQQAALDAAEDAVKQKAAR